MVISSPSVGKYGQGGGGTEYSSNPVKFNHKHVPGTLKINLFLSGYVKSSKILNENILHKNLLSKNTLLVDFNGIILL